MRSAGRGTITGLRFCFKVSRAVGLDHAVLRLMYEDVSYLYVARRSTCLMPGFSALLNPINEFVDLLKATWMTCMAFMAAKVSCARSQDLSASVREVLSVSHVCGASS